MVSTVKRTVIGAERWAWVLVMALLAGACESSAGVAGTDGAPPATVDTVPASEPPAASEPEVRPASWFVPEAPRTWTRHETREIADSAELAALVAMFEAELPATYAETTAEDLVTRTCSPDAGQCVDVHRRSVVVTDGDSATVSVVTEQLVEPASLYEMPLSDSWDRVVLPDGSELIADEWDANVRTVWIVRPDGLSVRVRAAGANPPDFSGWPTTAAPASDAGPPGPAPLTLADVRHLAQVIARGSD